MLNVLTLIGMVAAGFLLANFLFEKLKKKYGFISGIEYILLGILFNQTGIIDDDVVNQLGPVMSIGLGWFGLLFGLNLRFRELSTFKTEYYKVTMIENIFTFVLTGGSFFFILWSFSDFQKSLAEIVPVSVFVGATAVVSSPTALRSIKQRYQAKGKFSRFIEGIIGFDQLSGIILFGLAFCLFHVGETHLIRNLTTTEWFVLNIGFGVVLGVLFFLFLGKEQSEDKLFLALLGIIIFSSGIAYYLNLSPIFICLTLGCILANFSQLRKNIIEMLKNTEDAFYVILLIYAGATVDLPQSQFLLLIPVYVLVRYAGKFFGGYFAFQISESPEMYTRNIGNALVPQGAVAAAFIINYQQVYQNEYTDIITVCILSSILVSEFIGTRLTRNILIDKGEIKPEVLAVAPGVRSRRTPNDKGERT